MAGHLNSRKGHIDNRACHITLHRIALTKMIDGAAVMFDRLSVPRFAMQDSPIRRLNVSKSGIVVSFDQDGFRGPQLLQRLLRIALFKQDETLQHPRWNFVLRMTMSRLDLKRLFDVTQSAFVLPFLALASSFPIVGNRKHFPGSRLSRDFQHHIEMFDRGVQ